MRGLFYILTAVILLGGCRSSSEPEELRPVPFQLRSSLPGDSVTVDSSILDFSASFNQAPGHEDLVLLVVPRPISMGDSRVHGRSYDQLGIQLSSRYLSHRLLLDGPRLLHPYIVRIFTGYAGGEYDFPDPAGQPCLVVGELGEIGQIDGEVYSPPGGPDPRHSVIFAFAAETLPAEPDPTEIFFLSPALSVALPEFGSPRPGVWAYRVNSLLIYERYTVIAVLDTNGDGIYDPHEDWWGYPQDPATRRLSYAEAHIDNCTPRINPVVLRRPIGPDPAP